MLPTIYEAGPTLKTPLGQCIVFAWETQCH